MGSGTVAPVVKNDDEVGETDIAVGVRVAEDATEVLDGVPLNFVLRLIGVVNHEVQIEVLFDIEAIEKDGHFAPRSNGGEIEGIEQASVSLHNEPDHCVQVHLLDLALLGIRRAEPAVFVEHGSRGESMIATASVIVLSPLMKI